MYSRLTGSCISVNRYGEPALQWAGTRVYTSAPVHQDRSMVIAAGRIGNGNTGGLRNVQFTVSSASCGSVGEQPRYCSSVRLVCTLIESAKST